MRYTMGRKMWSMALMAGVLALAAVPLGAQVGGGGGGGGRGNFDPAAMKERMMTRYKEQLGVTDDEWKVLQPKIDKVQTLAMQSRMGGFGFGGRGGRGGGGAAPADATAQPANPVAEKSKELQTTIDDKGATEGQIKAKLTALREARTKAHEDLVKAQAELKELVTVRQEAVLVTLGLLE